MRKEGLARACFDEGWIDRLSAGERLEARSSAAALTTLCRIDEIFAGERLEEEVGWASGDTPGTIERFAEERDWKLATLLLGT